MTNTAKLDLEFKDNFQLIIALEENAAINLEQSLKAPCTVIKENRGEFELTRETKGFRFVVNYKPARPLLQQGYTLQETILHTIYVLNQAGYQVSISADFYEKINEFMSPCGIGITPSPSGEHFSILGE